MMSTVTALPRCLLLLSLAVFTPTNAQTRTVDGLLASVTVTGIAQANSIMSRLNAYQSQVTAEPKFSSVVAVIRTAIPDYIKESIADKLGGVGIGTAGSGTGASRGFPTTAVTDYVTTRAWYTSLSSDVKSYLQSIDDENMRLITATASGNTGGIIGKTSGGASGNVVAMMGVGLAAGLWMVLVL